MSNGQKPAVEQSRPRGRLPWLRQSLRRLLRFALADELAESTAELRVVEGRLHDLSDELLRGRLALERTDGELAVKVDRVGEDLTQLQSDLHRDVLGVADDARRLQLAHDNLQNHLETRLDQTGAEVADLRGAFLTARDEVGVLRDRVVPDLSARLDLSGDEHARITGTLQREIEGLRDARVPQLERAFGGFQVAIEAIQQGLDRVRDGVLAELQAEIEQVRDHRVAQAEGDLGRLQADLSGLQREIEGLRDRRVGKVESDLQTLGSDLEGVLHELEGVRDRRLAQVEGDLGRLQTELAGVQTEIEGVRDERLSRVEADLERQQDGIAAVLTEIETLRDHRLPGFERELSRARDALAGVQGLGEELRDRRLPALDGRVSALVERLHEELTATAGTVDRLCRREPLRVAAAPELEARIPEAVRAASQRFIDTFRGSAREVASRLEEYLPLLRDGAPVLDLGCGRGELLQLLQREGVTAAGVDSDPAMIAACHRRGLEAREADAIEALRSTPTGSLGAVVAVQLLEHLQPAHWMELVDCAGQALRGGGLLLVECPNPGSLRVGGSLFWLDPTHRVPIHPDALAFVVRVLGLEVVEVRLLHAFPVDQRLARVSQSTEVHELAERLDAWLSAPRDFLLVARKP